MLIDVHNHVMPTEALDVLRRDSSYGVTIDGNRWAGVHHVPFTIADATTRQDVGVVRFLIRLMKGSSPLWAEEMKAKGA